LDDVVYELARHFSRSRDDEKAWDYCIRAGEKAESAYAPEQAEKFYKGALKALKSGRGEKHREAEILERLGDNQRLTGAYTEALENFKRVGEITDENETKARMHRKCGFVHQKLGDYENSLDHVLKGEKIELGDRAERWRLVNQKAFVLLRTGEYDEGIALCEKAIEELTRLGGYDEDVGNSYNTLGACYRFKGDYEKALEYYNKSLKTCDVTGNLYTVASTLNNVGIIHHDRGELEQALEYYNRTLDIDAKIGNQYGLGASYNNIALILHDQDELEQALDYHRKGLRIREKIGDQDGIATSHINIGELLKDIGDLETSASENKMSIEMFRELGSKDGVVDGLLGLAETYLAGNDFEKALPLIREAEASAEEIGMKEQIAWARRTHALYLAGNEDWVGAEIKFKESLKDYEELDADVESAITLYRWGIMVLQKGDIEAGKEKLKKALDMFDDIGAKFWARKCREELDG
jgi:tetratricopeptide (TPR) repeat protein